MPKGEPTRVVRLPVWLCDQIEALAARRDPAMTLAQHIAHTYNPRPLPAPTAARRAQQRCDCKVPTISKVVSNLCTTCKRMR